MKESFFIDPQIWKRVENNHFTVQFSKREVGVTQKTVNDGKPVITIGARNEAPELESSAFVEGLATIEEAEFWDAAAEVANGFSDWDHLNVEDRNEVYMDYCRIITAARKRAERERFSRTDAEAVGRMYGAQHASVFSKHVILGYAGTENDQDAPKRTRMASYGREFLPA